MSRNEPPTERKAWIEARDAFDQAHDELERLLTELMTQAQPPEEGQTNGR